MKFPFDQKIELSNERVKLHPINSIAEVAALWSINEKHPNLMQFSPGMIQSEQDFQNYFAKAIRLKEQKSRYPFVIVDQDSGAQAGTTSYMSIVEEHGRLEIGSTWIGPSYQRTGLNRNVKLLMLSYAFDTLGVSRVELKTDARNKQSRNAILGIGAQYEGCLRSHTIMSDGFRRDTVYYSILMSEWPEVKERLQAKIK